MSGSTDDDKAAPPAVPGAAIEPPSPDVAPVQAESGMPGVHRGGFERWPTAPIGVQPTATAAPDIDAPVLWAPAVPTAPARGVAVWSLVAGIVALIVALFVGWGFLLGIVAIVTAIVALNRPLESRPIAVWGLVLGAVSLLYSGGWLLFAASQAGMIA